MKYLLDANFFITPSRTIFSMDICLGFWAKIRQLAYEGKIFTLDKVKEEIFVNDDDLKRWMEENLSESFYLSTQDKGVMLQLQRIVEREKQSDYTQKAKKKFLRLDKADIYLVSYALAYPAEWCVVSYERPAPTKQGEIKLPDICSQFNVRCMLPEEMFREMKETF